MGTETVDSLSTALLRRVRDPTGSAHDTATVYAVLSQAQRVVNAATKAVLIEQNIYRFPGNPFIPIAQVLDRMMRVEQVRAFGRALERSDWRLLQHHDAQWVKRRAALPLVWDQVGGDILCIWPAAATIEACQVTVVGTKYNADFVLATDILELPDQHAPQILTVAESLLLLRQRLMSKALQASAERMKAEMQQGRPTP